MVYLCSAARGDGGSGAHDDERGVAQLQQHGSTGRHCGVLPQRKACYDSGVQAPGSGTGAGDCGPGVALQQGSGREVHHNNQRAENLHVPPRGRGVRVFGKGSHMGGNKVDFFVF